MSILEKYYQYENISGEREQELFKNINNQESREEIIKSHLKLVASIAKQYSFLNNAISEDLLQEGTLGLVLAIDKFNPDLGFRFSTFASFYIRNRIRQALRKSYFFIHIPQPKLHKIFKLINEMRSQKKEGESMSVDEICDVMNCNESQAKEMISIIYSERSYCGEESGAKIDTEKLERRLKLMEISEILRYFPESDQKIISLRYTYGHTWREIGNKVSMSHEGCRKRHDKIIQMIRDQIIFPEDSKINSSDIYLIK